MYRWLLASILFTWLSHASDSNLLSVLSSQRSLTKFTSLINQYPDVLAAAQAGSITVIAPNDDAFESYFASPGPTGNYSTPDQLHALIQYHVLKGAYSSFTITSKPTFLPTILTNQSYTNVTTGQVVEAVTTNGSTITFHSAVHQASNVLVSDLLFLGGYIHIVDTVLIPPLDILATVAAYPLTYFVQALSTVLNDNFTQAIQEITDLPNTTYFLANDKDVAVAVANDTRVLTDAFVLNQTENIIIPGSIAYSTALVTGYELTNMMGVNLTITEINGDIYVNDAKIVVRDLLIANGVVHVIDKWLDSDEPGTRPQLNDTVGTPASNTTAGGTRSTVATQEGLSTGAKVGISVGVVVIVAGLFATAAIFIRRRLAHAAGTRYSMDHIREVQSSSVHEKDSHLRPHELITKSYDAAELPAKTRAQELDGTTKSDSRITTSEKNDNLTTDTSLE